MYILDTDALIQLKESFSIERPGDVCFWEHFLSLGVKGIIKIPEMVCLEICKGNDKFAEWLKTNKGSFLLKTDTVIHEEFGAVVAAYESLCPNYTITEQDIEFLGSKADAFLVAHGLRECGSVVTLERPNKATVLKNIKIPSVCAKLGVECTLFPRFVWEVAEMKFSNQ